MSPIWRVGVALGANQGDRLANLRLGFRWLRGISAGPAKVSKVYETEPVGCPPGAPWFLNAVGEIGWGGDPLELLRRARVVEADAGRRRDGMSNRPRPLDIDLLYAGDQVVRTAELVLPHPRMTQRRFVMQPLNEIRPDLILPGQIRCVSELLAVLEEHPAVRAYPGSLNG